MVVLISVVATASCSGGNNVVEEPEATTTTSAVTTIAAEFTEIATTVPERESFADGPLADVCPETIVVQINDLPSVEHGALFRLLGSDPVVDDAGQIVTAPLVRVDGTAEAVVLEIRAGGPAAEFRAPIDVMAADESITLAEASTAEAAGLASAFPTVGVITLTDISHQMLMWDPATYPEVTSIDELAVTGAEILHITGERFINFLVDRGNLTAENLTDGFFGEPAAFVTAGGALAQQGDALVEPFLFPALPQWAAPINFALAADAGWDSYDDSLIVRPEFAAANRQCLGRLVPVIQESMVAYSLDSAPTNQLMASIRELFNPLTRAAPELLEQGAAAATSTGIFGGGPDGVVGSFDMERANTFVDLIGDGSISAEELMTNDFIDLEVAL